MKLGAFTLFTFATLVGAPPLCAQSVPEKAEAAMHRVFGVDATVRTYSLVIEPADSEAVYDATGASVSGRVIIREAFDHDNHVLGYGIVDDVRGKEQPITYIAMMRPDNTLAEIEVLVYRESYGGEVQYSQFRDQFKGKGDTRQVRVGHGIQSIAGATISSNAITKGAQKILVLFQRWRSEKKL